MSFFASFQRLSSTLRAPRSGIALFSVLCLLLSLSCREPPSVKSVQKTVKDAVTGVYNYKGKPDKAYRPLDKNDPKVKADQWPPKQFPMATPDQRTGPGKLSPGKGEFQIIDIHEHAQTERDVKMLIEGMDRFGIKTTCLMASTIYTFTLNPIYGFEDYKKNNEDILRYKKMYPGRICAFITIDPSQPGNLELVKDYVARGADGIKLYLGHGAKHGKGPFHVVPLDDETMLPIYKYAESIQLPILMHVNLIKFMDELVRVLEKTPYLRLCVPHFGLHKNTAARLARLGWIFDRYPNFYTDISFGYFTFHKEGFEALARWRTRSRKYFSRYSKRIMFGSDMVLEKGKDEQHVDEVLRSYMQFLETKEFRFFMAKKQMMWGLDLPPPILRDIYVTSARNFLQMNDKGELLDRSKVVPSITLDGLPPSVPTVVPLKPGEGPPPERRRRKK